MFRFSIPPFLSLFLIFSLSYHPSFDLFLHRFPSLHCLPLYLVLKSNTLPCAFYLWRINRSHGLQSMSSCIHAFYFFTWLSSSTLTCGSVILQKKITTNMKEKRASKSACAFPPPCRPPAPARRMSPAGLLQT